MENWIWPVWDSELFLVIHSRWTADWLDFLVPFWRDKRTWVPLYVLLGFLIIQKNRLTGVLIAALAGFSVGLADGASSALIKPLVGRLRPCRTPELALEIRHLVECGPGLSFPSSHATNHFALAVLLYMLFHKRYPVASWAGLLWALSIGYAQVYAGLHFPLDVIAGSLLGAAIGWLVSLIFFFFRPGWNHRGGPGH